jgi:hypothetical protein
MMLEVTIPVDTGNAAIADGSLAPTLMKFVEKMQPEVTYFIVEDDIRTVLFFLDMQDATDLRSLAAPFFLGLEADVTMTRAMDLADMQAGVEKALAASLDCELPE